MGHFEVGGGDILKLLVIYNEFQHVFIFLHLEQKKLSKNLFSPLDEHENAELCRPRAFYVRRNQASHFEVIKQKIVSLKHFQKIYTHKKKKSQN